MSEVARLDTRPDMVRAAAISHGVCIRPLLHDVYDSVTGHTRTVPIPCGSTRESQCPPCADSARKLRMTQCREGWHLTEEPATGHTPASTPATRRSPAWWWLLHHREAFAAWALLATLARGRRRSRTTRRRQDVPDLPKLPMADRTIGQRYEGNAGRTYTPSMFLTHTLDSYGPVHPDGTPLDPSTYDYRRAALDVLHFGKLADRWWQNLRRCAGYKVQYFATVEPQQRLAPHLHSAIRGTIPRAVIRQVTAATYHQVWWPAHDTPVYTGPALPVWDQRCGGYVDPHTGRSLPTWDQALDELDADPDAEPVHVVRFGRQVHMKGILPGTPDSDRRIGYLTKYGPPDLSVG